MCALMSPRSPRLLFGIVLLLCAPLAMAQNNLGELLDAGATRLSPEAFKEEVVQRVIVGRTTIGGNIEVMYAQSGEIAGLGSYTADSPTRLAAISGEWKLDDNGRVCTAMRISSAPGGGTLLSPRCQFWFKHNGQYFISDYDSDRSARVLRRTLKQ
jgi:hypothetical protein